MQLTLTFIGLMSLYLAVTALRTCLRDRKRSFVSAVGMVVDMERKKDGNTISFTPVYEYQYAGQTYRGKHRISSSKYGKGMTVVAASKYEIGSEIPLLVDENEPGYSMTDDGSQSLNVLGPLLFLAIGIGSLICAFRMF